MARSKIYSVSTISLIFLIAVLAILITFFIAHFYFGAQFGDDKDIFNWVGLVIEIGVAAGITGAIWYYTKTEQTKTNRLILKIHEITEKLDRVINEQNKLQKSRKEFLHESLYGNLISVITSSYNISQGNTMRKFISHEGVKITELNEYILLDQMSKVLTEKIKQFNDLLDPELYAALSTVCNLIKEKGMGDSYAKSIIQQSKRGLNAIDTSLFAIENIDNSILEKI